ncbi:unnamed protein product, partial [Vitis vinifera]|uniref:Carbonic anhydrase n=1 Tax=Vitis vinifera TaxID=29760 RepID=D7SHR4_VITVI
MFFFFFLVFHEVVVQKVTHFPFKHQTPRIQMNIKNLQKASTPSFWCLHARTLEFARLMSSTSSHEKPSWSGTLDFIDDWVKIGLPAKAKVKSEWGDKSFEQHCQYCEKESGNSSLVNLLSDPYARAAVAERDLKLVGGYYNFVHGTFGLWEVDVDIDIVCVNINKWQKK